MTEHLSEDQHERFRELSALANTGTLSPGEIAELTGHFQVCSPCREIHDQYRLLAREGVPVLAAAFSEEKDFLRWDDTATRKKLLARVRAAEQQRNLWYDRPVKSVGSGFYGSTLVNRRWAGATLAACVLVLAGFAGYRLGTGTPKALSVPTARFEKVESDRKSAKAQLRAEERQGPQAEQDSLKRDEIAKLRARLRELQNHITLLEAAQGEATRQLQAVSQQRDLGSAQLRDAERAYQAELATLRSERDKTLSQTGPLESKIAELTVVNRDQERRLKDDEQYLASDRDIRDLMGARKLYIADVFDVDSGSQTKRPSGRIFYTQGKSLIFYAFDLDRQSGVNNASTFQVWGQKEMAQEEQARPMSLGVLYMDNESNRRWVMRFDDPKQLAEIDAVFVTVEPRGGSRKPSSKPFLYALLRKEVNHP
jgi:hypothetical protein